MPPKANNNDMFKHDRANGRITARKPKTPPPEELVKREARDQYEERQYRDSEKDIFDD